MGFKLPQDKLPKKGQRVLTCVIKEMIYKGNEVNSGSDWIDDGEGFRAIMGWWDLEDKDASEIIGKNHTLDKINIKTLN
jgi:hypothetical protein